MRERRTAVWVGRTLVVLGVLLALYPGLHKSALGFTTSCGPAVFVAFPGDPGSASEAQQVSMNACLKQGMILLLAGVGLFVSGALLIEHHPRRARVVPPRPDHG